MVCQNEKGKKSHLRLLCLFLLSAAKGALVGAACDCVCGPKYQKACMDDVVAI